MVITRAAEEIVRVKLADWEAAGVLESVTLNVSGVLVTATVGVPVMDPVAAFRVKPVGRVPLVRDQAKGVVAPVAERVVEYGVLTCPLGSEVVLIARGGREMVRVRPTVFVDAGLLESVTVKISGVLVTAIVGVPEIAPEDEFSDNPAGRVPVVRDQAYGAWPPCAVNVAA